LELKVIADVGLVGFPNVGKSSFLSRVTNAKPKIANYHFTTLNPNLGVVDLEGTGGFVIADIPGLIEGASEGIGLGHEFLRHIERTKVIIHIVDAAGTEGRDPIEDIYAINKELEAYNPDLLKKPQVIAANKTDAIYGDENEIIASLRAEFEEKEGIKVYPISAVSGKGLKELLYHVKELLATCPKEVTMFETEFDPSVMSIIDELREDPEFKNLSIGVITFYSKQVTTLFEEAAKPEHGYVIKDKDGYNIAPKYRTLDGDKEKFRIGSVDSFQGKEFDIVILSTVRSNSQSREDGNEKKVFGFLTLENRLNVAFSRAQKLVIVVGDANMFEDNYAKKYVPGLHEFCTNITKNKEYGSRI
jgi:small GTP-binding protein